MLGKTHVALSTATAHAALVAYTAYAGTRMSIDGSVTFDVFGVPLGRPVDLIVYGLMVSALTFFILFLLRVGIKPLYGTYLALTAMFVVLVALFGGSEYPSQLLWMGLLFTLGSLLPDIDEPNSTLGKYVPFVGAVIPHRTITHTIWVIGVLAGLSWWLSSPYMAALTLGYAFHVTQDAFSKQGICWFYPLFGSYTSYGGGAVVKTGRKTNFAYKTGGTMELVLFIGAILVHVGCVAYVFYQTGQTPNL